MKFKLTILSVLFSVFLFPLISLADRSTAGDINNFDIQPRTLTPGQTANVNFRFTVYGGSPSAYFNYCGFSSNQNAEIFWKVYERLSNGQDRTIREGRVIYNPFTYSNRSYNASFSQALPDLNGTRTFYGQIYCTFNAVTRIMSTSAGVTVAQSSSGTSGGGNTGGGGGGNQNPGSDFSFPNPLESQTIFGLFDGLINLAFTIGLPIAVIMIVYSGVMFLWSRGNPAQVTKARTILLWAVVGLAVLLIGKGFLTLIRSILELAQ